MKYKDTKAKTTRTIIELIDKYWARAIPYAELQDKLRTIVRDNAGNIYRADAYTFTFHKNCGKKRIQEMERALQ